MVRILHLIGLCALALPLWAGESILLQTGFQLSADRHEIDGSTIRIFSGVGVAEMPLRMVAGIETIESAPVPAQGPALTPAAETPTAKPARANLTPAQLAESAARKYALPGSFVTSVMRAESGFNPAALSPKGAIGLMQLMPATAQALGVDPKKPAENADAGARYLRDLLALYEDDPNQVVLALAAYNAGPAAVGKYHGVPPYRETREYILRVLKNWNPPPTVPDSSQSASKLREF